MAGNKEFKWRIKVRLKALKFAIGGFKCFQVFPLLE